MIISLTISAHRPSDPHKDLIESPVNNITALSKIKLTGPIQLLMILSLLVLSGFNLSVFTGENIAIQNIFIQAKSNPF